jgi:hypothetical protein
MYGQHPIGRTPFFVLSSQRGEARLNTLVNKDRTGEIMLTEWTEEGSPNKFCSMCFENITNHMV